MSFKKRAPRAIKAIREFAVKAMVCRPHSVPPFNEQQRKVAAYNHSHLLSAYNPIALQSCSYLSVRCHRALQTSALIRNSTRKSGNLASKASHSVCVYAFRGNVTTRRARRKSCTPTCKRSMSKIPRGSVPSSSRSLEHESYSSRLETGGEESTGVWQ